MTSTPHDLSTPPGNGANAVTPVTWRSLVNRISSAGNLGWSLGALAISALLSAPLVAIAILALESSGDTWPHLIETVLPSAVARTLLLMAGVGAITLVIGAGTAWLVTMYRFPLSGWLEWMLLLPLAVPTYIIAFCYLELFDYAGTIQTSLRGLFGWQNASQYWFPDIRSLWGAILVMSFVLYPYVYLTARASFLQQSVCVLEVSRTLGRSAWGCLWEVALPLARPALVAGMTLALMECLNDIGAVEFLGVNTLTVSVYTTWLDRGSLAGAAQIACVMLLFVMCLLWAERTARARQRFHHTTGKYRHLPEERLTGWSGVAALTACAAPVAIGFALPISVLVGSALENYESALAGAFWRDAGHSLLLSVGAACLAVTLAIVLAYARRATRSKLVHGATGLAAVGYAVPGTVLAIGILVPLAAFDNAVDAFLRASLGISTGLLLSGSVFALIFAYTARFMAVSLGPIDASFKKTSRNLDAASRTLGVGLGGTLFRVHLPILAPAIGAAALLVFVDSMKELPASLLLRPFNFDTLATHVYTLASLDQFEEAALAALTIVVIGLAPIILMHRAIALARPGMKSSSA
jgi:iron(III) transport system permease protein